MLIFDELKLSLLSLKDGFKNLYAALDLDEAKDEVAKLEAESASPECWSNLVRTQKIMQRIKVLKDKLGAYEKLDTLREDMIALSDLGNEMEDESVAEEVKVGYNSLVNELEMLRLTTLLTGEYDPNNAIVTFHAGAGGTEAQDWAQMLFRMYQRWAEKHKYKVKILDYLDGDEAGLKSAVMLIEGLNAFGFLKSEMGVHRLVRISPFDSSGRRHTSFASIEVMPEIDDNSKLVDIKDDDLKVDTYRSGGAGGQHVNKTESAIRITHLPTGIVVACQNERSQHQNRDFAMKMLRSKLIEIKEREHLDRIEDIKGDQKEIGWGAQIRSYVFMPYTLVKDHRTNFESGNVIGVMDGELDGFINAYLLL